MEITTKVAKDALAAEKAPLKVAFLVGNGFDIGLGLKTAYSDFIKHYIDRKVEHNEIVTKLIAAINKDIKNWGDAEYAFGQLPFSEFYHDIEESFRICLKDFQIALENYLRDEATRLIIPREKAESTRAKLLGYIVEAIATANSAIFNGRDNVSIDIVNFNYTDTVDRLLCFDGNKYPDVEATINEKRILITSNRLCHVHGQLGDKILFGVNSYDQIGSKELRYLSATEGYLVKSAKAHIGGCQFYYTAQDVISKCDVVFLFGLSYGKTDLRWWEAITDYAYLSEHGVLRNIPTIILCPYSLKPIDSYTIEDSVYIVRQERNRFLHELQAKYGYKYSDQIRGLLYVVGYGPFPDPRSNEQHYCDPLHLHSLGSMFVNGYDRMPILHPID